MSEFTICFSLRCVVDLRFALQGILWIRNRLTKLRIDCRRTLSFAFQARNSSGLAGRRRLLTDPGFECSLQEYDSTSNAFNSSSFQNCSSPKAKPRPTITSQAFLWLFCERLQKIATAPAFADIASAEQVYSGLSRGIYSFQTQPVGGPAGQAADTQVRSAADLVLGFNATLPKDKDQKHWTSRNGPPAIRVPLYYLTSKNSLSPADRTGGLQSTQG